MFETFYIHGEELSIPSIIIAVLALVLMPLLFALAGISSRYALEKRTAGEYAKERINKLLVPFTFGVLLIVPIQPYLAQRFRNGDAGYFESFTKITDLSGYDGAFAVAHLWFLLFLFVISLFCLPFMVWYKTKGKGMLGENVPLFCVFLMGLLPAIGSMFNIFGESPTEFMAYFLLGYFFLSSDNLLSKLEKYRHLSLGLFVVTAAVVAFVIGFRFYEVPRWFSILAALGYSRRHLDYSSKLSSYFFCFSFGVYMFHQSWIVVVAFFVFKLTDIPLQQIPLILVASVILTYASYEVCSRVPIVRWMLGLNR
jgi:surface polysaccharide O-acyltransferase-like enzyme